MLKLIIYSIIAFALSALILCSAAVISDYPPFVLSAIIGGASGNTSTFIAFKWSKKALIVGLIIQTVILIVLLSRIVKIISYLKNQKKKIM